jgi:hypothetical protein
MCCRDVHVDYNANAGGAAGVPTQVVLWTNNDQQRQQVVWSPIANAGAAPPPPVWWPLDNTGAVR